MTKFEPTTLALEGRITGIIGKNEQLSKNLLYSSYCHFQDDYSKLAAQINSTKKLLEELGLEEGEQIDPKAEKLK